MRQRPAAWVWISAMLVPMVLGADESVVTVPPGDAFTTAQALRYKNRIQEITRSQGAASYALAEQWLALGFAQQHAGRHESAVLSFENAMQIERIHRGLHESNQIDLIERLATSNRALGDWPAVAQNYTLMRWINARGRAPDDPARTETLRELARWHLEAGELPTGKAPFAHLNDAADLTDEALRLTEAKHGANAPALVELLILRAAVSHRIANHMSTWVGEPVHGVTPDAVVASGSSDASDAIFRQNLIVSNYTAGRDALERAAGIAAMQNDKGAQARCQQLLGDWQLLFGRRQAAAQHYDRAERLGREADVDLFAGPRQLPNFVDLRRHTHGAAPRPANFVRTRFDIDPQGRARNVEILEVSPPGRNLMVRQAREQLRGMRFRPRFIGGKAVKSEGIEIRIVFPEPGSAQGAQS